MISFIAKSITNQARLIRDRFTLERIAAQHPTCRVDPRARIKLDKGCHLRLGEQVVICSYSVISVERDQRSAFHEEVTLEIGARTYIGELNNIRAAGKTLIGSNCLISQGVSIIGSNHSVSLGLPMTEQPSRTDKLGVIVEDDVWIGTNAVILPGVRVGRGAVVGAGSVVTTDVENNTIVGGCPARVLKIRT